MLMLISSKPEQAFLYKRYVFVVSYICYTQRLYSICSLCLINYTHHSSYRFNSPAIPRHGQLEALRESRPPWPKQIICQKKLGIDAVARIQGFYFNQLIIDTLYIKSNILSSYSIQWTIVFSSLIVSCLRIHLVTDLSHLYYPYSLLLGSYLLNNTPDCYFKLNSLIYILSLNICISVLRILSHNFFYSLYLFLYCLYCFRFSLDSQCSQKYPVFCTILFFIFLLLYLLDYRFL